MRRHTLRPEYECVERLSLTEYAIFLLLGDGLSTRQIADKRNSSIKTIDCHVSNMKEKVGCQHSRALQVLAAKFVNTYGKPRLAERVIERRLVFDNGASEKVLT